MNRKPVKDQKIDECIIIGQKMLINTLPVDQHLALKRLKITIDLNALTFTYNRCLFNQKNNKCEVQT